MPFISVSQNDPKFKHFTTSDGLSHNYVYCATQDHHGFIWAGGPNGLNRYDGNEFVVYRNVEGDSTSLSNNKVDALFEDGDHNFWIGTRDGLNLLNRSTDNFQRFYPNPDAVESSFDNWIWSILEDSHRNLWVGTATDLLRFDGDSWTFTSYPLFDEKMDTDTSGRIDDIYEDHSGNVWFAAQYGLYRYSYKSNKMQHIDLTADDTSVVPNTRLFGLYEDNDKKMWIGGQNVVYEYDPIDNSYVEYTHDPADANSITGGRMLGAIDYDEDHLLISTYEGLNILNRTNDQIHSILVENAGIYKDDQNIVWVKGMGKGLMQVDPSTNAVSHYVHGNKIKNPLSDYSGCTAHEDSKGIIQLGTHSIGLNRLDRNAESFEALFPEPSQKGSLSGTYIHAIMEDSKGNLWVGSDAGLDVMYRSRSRFQKVEPIGNDPHLPNIAFVYCIHEDHNGIIWIGSDYGLIRYDDDSAKMDLYGHDDQKASSISNNSITAIDEDHLGNLWIGTLDGLNRFISETGEIQSYFHDDQNPYSISDNYIDAIHMDAQNRLWFGTAYGGLNRFDSGTGWFYHYKIRQVQFKRRPGEHHPRSGHYRTR